MKYIVKIREVLRDFGSEYLKMIEIKVTQDLGKFSISSDHLTMEISDGTNVVTVTAVVGLVEIPRFKMF